MQYFRSAGDWVPSVNLEFFIMVLDIFINAIQEKLGWITEGFGFCIFK